jgi:urea transporter
LGGTRLTLATTHLGGVAIWASMLVESFQAPLYALAYLLWSVALLRILTQSWRILQAGLLRIEAGSHAPGDGTSPAPLT